MKFIKYNSIDNLYNKDLQSFKDSRLYDPRDTWYVTCKLDGTNLSIWFDDKLQPYAAKRKAVLLPEEDFFNYQSVMQRYFSSFSSLR